MKVLPVVQVLGNFLSKKYEKEIIRSRSCQMPPKATHIPT